VLSDVLDIVVGGVSIVVVLEASVRHIFLIFSP